MDWTPFEDRPRPAQLGKVVLALDRMKRIEIVSDDEEAIGVIFAWLLGQAQLARSDPHVLKGRGLGLGEG
jgi:hypothetical protein